MRTIKTISDYITQIKTNKIFRKTIIAYSIIACALFFTFCLVTTILMSNAAIKQLQISEQKMLSQSENTADSILRNINYYITDAFENNDDIQNAMQLPYSPELSIRTSKIISTIKTSYDSIDNVFIFNLKEDLIYSGEAPVYSSDTFTDQSLISMFRSSDFYTINAPYRLEYENYQTNELEKKNVLLSIYKQDDMSGIVICLNDESFNNLVNIQKASDNEEMTIIDSGGIVISSNNPDYFGKDFNKNPTYQKLMTAPNDVGVLKTFDSVFFYRRANNLGTMYVSRMYRMNIITTFLLQFIIVLLFAIILIFMLFMSSIKLSVSIFKPFKRLRYDIASILKIDVRDAETGTEEELEKISENLTRINSEYVSMQTTEQRYNISKKNELIYNILSGTYNIDSEILKKYQISFPHKYTTVIIFRIDNAPKITRSDLNLIQYGIGNVALEIMSGENMVSYQTSFGGECDVTLIVNHSSPELPAQYPNDIKKYIYNIFKITATASYSTSAHDFESISELYHNAKYAMQYRLTRGYDSLISYDSISFPINEKIPEYPYETEKKLIHAINSKSDKDIQLATDEFIEYISHLQYMHIIVYTCIMTMAIDSLGDNFGEQNKDMLQSSPSGAETLSQIRQQIIAKSNSAMMSAPDIQSDTKYALIANSIEDYIDKNFTDPNLSIYVIAEYVNKSANYTRNIFKKNKGISISDYIVKKRFSNVCTMLVKTNLTSQEIAGKSGLTSGSYFYTSFKKYTGYTPEQFRNKYYGTDIDNNQ